MPSTNTGTNSEYKDDELENAVEQAAVRAEAFVKEFGNHQAATLPWLKKK